MTEPRPHRRGRRGRHGRVGAASTRTRIQSWRRRSTGPGAGLAGLLLVLAFSPSLFGADLEVPAAYPTIQAAIDAALDGDRVQVSPGLYAERIDFVGKAIVVESVGGAGATVIDALGVGSVVTFSSGEAEASVLEGFTLRGGVGTDLGATLVGGGIVIIGSAPTIRSCVIEDNSADLGGGVAIVDGAEPRIEMASIRQNSATTGGGIAVIGGSAPTILSLTVESNVAGQAGGGIHAADGALDGTDLTISNNTAGSSGGGIHCSGGGIYRLTDCEITSNEAQQGGGIAGSGAAFRVSGGECRANFASASGGGCFLSSASFSRFERMRFEANEAGTGGGFFVVADFPRIINCEVVLNVANANGGGAIFLNSGGVVAGNRVVDNESGLGGGGIYALGGNTTFGHNTIAGNRALDPSATGGGMLLRNNSSHVVNSLVWGNVAPTDANLGFIAPGAPVFTHCNLEGGWSGAGEGNFEEDPLFQNAAAGDYSLLLGSPCADRGVNELLPVDIVDDVEGGARIVCAVVDVGAEELDPPAGACPTVFVRGDCAADGVIDLTDALEIAFVVSFGGVFDCAPACDPNDDGQVDVADAVTLLGALFVAGSPEPASPFPGCGIDVTPDPLICGASTPCP